MFNKTETRAERKAAGQWCKVKESLLILHIDERNLRYFQHMSWVILPDGVARGEDNPQSYGSSPYCLLGKCCWFESSRFHFTLRDFSRSEK